ncbi:hypothetical protein [Acinetobacter nosocomialis]|uniref:hypothetical protein n=1 Tax=Acinetobacter nosocomialis TaxID=106654 RepID=UPI001962A233|nr:hypothetical protein [Acinetobacter nosocomialis]MBM9550000.1 hypothetical protein [Acinetobacter nosocomialis]
MSIVNPIPPLRKDLEIMCGGNLRLVKAFEAVFRLIPNELNNLDGSSSDAQISADSAATQASLAISQIEELKQLLEMVLLQSSACNCQCYQDIPIRTENVQENLILSPAQLIEPDNLYLEVN